MSCIHSTSSLIDKRSSNENIEDTLLPDVPQQRARHSPAGASTRSFMGLIKKLGNTLMKLFCCFPSRKQPLLGQIRVTTLPHPKPEMWHRKSIWRTSGRQAQPRFICALSFPVYSVLLASASRLHFPKIVSFLCSVRTKDSCSAPRFIPLLDFSSSNREKIR